MNQSLTRSKLHQFKNFEGLVFDDFLSKTQKARVFLLVLIKKTIRNLPLLFRWYQIIFDQCSTIEFKD